LRAIYLVLFTFYPWLLNWALCVWRVSSSFYVHPLVGTDLVSGCLSWAVLLLFGPYMLLQMTVAVVLTAPPFGIVVLFSLFFRVLFLLFHVGWLDVVMMSDLKYP
jgi:hypothetical protein